MAHLLGEWLSTARFSEQVVDSRLIGLVAPESVAGGVEGHAKPAELVFRDIDLDGDEEVTFNEFATW